MLPICEWVKSCWEAVPIEMVKDFFLSFTITTSTDGRDDDIIHCFKPGQPCKAGRSVLVLESEKLTEASSTAADDHDPFVSDADEEETENSEVLIDNGDDQVDGELSSKDSEGYASP